MTEKNKRPVQYFSDEYLERCKGMTPYQILKALDDYRLLQGIHTEKLKLISIKIAPSLLVAFKTKAKLEGIPYQTKIKNLMYKDLN